MFDCLVGHTPLFAEAYFNTENEPLRPFSNSPFIQFALSLYSSSRHVQHTFANKATAAAASEGNRRRGESRHGDDDDI